MGKECAEAGKGARGRHAKARMTEVKGVAWVFPIFGLSF